MAALGTVGWPVEPHPMDREGLRAALADAELDRFWRLAAEAGVQVRHLAPVRVSLEDVFVGIVEGRAGEGGGPT